MKGWLKDALAEQVLSEELEGYLLGRGGQAGTISEMGLCTWQPLSFDVPEPTFVGWYGSRGERLEGNLVIPLRSPRGSLIGIQAREVSKKKITRYLLPSAAWNPLWIGMGRALPKIWAGGTIWICEGLFDLFALEWVIPEGDAVLAAIRAKLTRKQVQCLKRWGNYVNMVFDKDEAGKKGVHGYVDDTGREVWGALRSLRHENIPCRDYPYIGGSKDDPGSIWNKGGVEALQHAFRSL
jgi:hypothetical protein